MTAEPVEVGIDRLVLDGIDIRDDAALTLRGLIETELQRILDGGPPAGVGAPGPAELQPLILATPPDVPALARALAERIADRVAAQGAWDG